MCPVPKVVSLNSTGVVRVGEGCYRRGRESRFSSGEGQGSCPGLEVRSVPWTVAGGVRIRGRGWVCGKGEGTRGSNDGVPGRTRQGDGPTGGGSQWRRSFGRKKSPTQPTNDDTDEN